MMNDLLRNIIKIGDVVVFINNMMVEIETEKEYVICQVHLSRKHIPGVYSLSTAKAHLLWQPPYLQHTVVATTSHKDQ